MKLAYIVSTIQPKFKGRAGVLATPYPILTHDSWSLATLISAHDMIYQAHDYLTAVTGSCQL